MEQLLRMEVGSFSVQNSIHIAEIEKRAKDGTILEMVTAVDQMFEKLRKVTVKKMYQKLLENGNPFVLGYQREKNEFQDQEQVRVYDEEGIFYGIYRFEENRKGFWPVKIFFEKE